MPGKIFESMRIRALREHKHSIVRSARIGHKSKGRGLVLVKCTKEGTVRLSYLTLDAIKNQRPDSGPRGRHSEERLIKKISTYSPESEILVMVTDGEFERLSLGVKRPAQSTHATF